MTEFHKDIIVGVLFVLGLFGFFSGEFLISTGLFGIAAVTSNLNFRPVRLDHDDKDETVCD